MAALSQHEHDFSEFGAMSWLKGLPDILYAVPAVLKKHLLPSHRHWTGGWGDLDRAQKMYPEVRVQYEKHCAGPEFFGRQVQFPVEGEDAEHLGKPQILHGELKSPLHAFMPEECSTLPFEVVLPAEEPWAVVILCGGTADEHYFYRRNALAEPLRARGVACILPTMPFYGPRRRKGQKMHYLNTFYDLMVQCWGGGMENIALLDWARLKWPKALLGVAGMSHGAGTAATSAIYACHDLAVTPVLIPTSPAVLATGSLVHDLALDALGAGGKPGQASREEVLDILVETLEHALGAEAGGEIVPPKVGTFTKCVTAVSAYHDSFVLPEWSNKAVDQVKKMLDPDAKHLWISGGHVSSFFIPKKLVEIIIESFHRLEPTQGSLRSRL